MAFPDIPATSIFSPGPITKTRVWIQAALTQFGFGALDISLEDLTSPGKVIQLGYAPNRIDLMTSITGVSFEDAWSKRVAGEIDGLRVCFMGRVALLKNKELTGRNKDKIDADQLRRQSRE